MATGGQTSYQLNPDIGVAGQLADENLDSRVVSYPAGEPISFGRLCEVDSSGLLHPVRGTGANIASDSLAGVSVFDVAREQQLASSGGSAGSGFYGTNDMVPVLRKGRIYAAWDGSGTQAILGRINVNHPSTGDTNGVRGVFTGSATSTTAGAEVTQCPAEILSVRDVSASTPRRNNSAPNDWELICLLEVNLPGA